MQLEQCCSLLIENIENLDILVRPWELGQWMEAANYLCRTASVRAGTEYTEAGQQRSRGSSAPWCAGDIRNAVSTISYAYGSSGRIVEPAFASAAALRR